MRAIIIYILCGFVAILDIWFVLYLLNSEFFFIDDIRNRIRKKI